MKKVCPVQRSTRFTELICCGYTASYDACAEVYKGRDDLWYVRVIHRNGRKLLKSGDGYERKSDARKVLYYLSPGTVKGAKVRAVK